MRDVFCRQQEIDMIYLILLLSGFSSLYYEFLALKYTEIFLGVSIFAVSIVLLTFLTGMLFGNLLSGRFLKGNSNKQLARILIITEALIVPAALLTPWLIELTSQIYGANVPVQWPLYARMSIKYLLFLPAFLPLSTLLGLRFPLYLKLFNPGNRIGLLYGVSCLGSAAGALAGGFFMFEYLNLYSSLVVCVSIVSVFNITGLLIYSKTRLKGKDSSAAAKPSKNKNKGGSPLLKNNMAAVTLFFLLGMITIGLELLWVRALMQYFPNNRYVFSTVTVALLAALFLGSISNRFFKSDKKSILYACLILAAGAQLCLGLQEYFNFFKHFAALDSLTMFSLNAVAMMMLVAGLPGFIMGLLFPMLFNYSLSRQAADNARLTFLSVTANSAGAICGALLFGMILMSVAGYNILFTGVNLIILIVAAVEMLKRKNVRDVFICLAAVALFAASAYPLFREVPYGNYYRLAKITGPDADIEIFAEKDFDNPNRILALNRTYVSGGSGYIAERRQKKQGLIPILLAPRKDSALVISLATGITASAFADAGVVDIDCVELLPTAIKQASYFQRQNSDILNDRCFNLFIDDGRMFIKNAKRKYDIILSDNYQYSCASTPVMYSLETFSDIKKIMSDNGVFIQWLPLRQIPPEHLAIIINTFRQVFPDGKLYFEDITRESAFLGLLAYKNGGATYRQAAQNYLEIKDAASKSLLNHDIACAYYVGTAAEYNRMFPASEINTYEHPALEKYFSGHDFNDRNMNNLLALYRQSRPDAIVPFNNALADSARRNIFTGLESVFKLKQDKQYAAALQALDNLLQSSNLNSQSISTFFPEVSFLQGELATALAVQSLTQGNLTAADNNFKIAEATIFRNSLFYRFNGILAGLKGDVIAAQVAFGRALQAQPENLWVYESMALTWLHYGNREKALEAMQKALAMPYPDKAILRTAMNIYMRLDCYNDFLPVLEEYLTLPDPDKRILTYCANYLKNKDNPPLFKKVEKILNAK